MSLKTNREGLPGDKWEISVSSPTNLEVDPSLSGGNQKLSPRPAADNVSSNVLNTDDCWLINIKAPATLKVDTAEPDEAGNQVCLMRKS